MMDDPNSHLGRDGHKAMGPDAALPPELESLAQRLSADGAFWQAGLPDPVKVADRLRMIPQTAPRTLDERRSLMSSPVGLPPENSQAEPRSNGRPSRLGPQRGLLAVLAAVLIVGLLAVVIVQFAQKGGASTVPVGQPTQTQPAPTETQPLPTATQPAPTATATTDPNMTWTTIEGFTAGGNYKTTNFSVTSPWRLVWQCNLSMGNPGPYPLIVSAFPSSGPGGATEVLDVSCQSGNTIGTSAQQTSPIGLIYLSVSSAADGEWDLRVQVLR